MFINVSIQYFQLTKSIPSLAQSARSKVPCPVIIFVTNESDTRVRALSITCIFFNLYEISVAFFLAISAILNYCIAC